MTNNTAIPLRNEERERLDAAREWLKGHYIKDPDESYASVDSKLTLIDIILRSGWLEPTQTWELQALGIAFGDALAQKLKLEWVTVQDEYGSDPALNWPGTSVFCYPMTSISKRVEQGMDINVHELFDLACTQLSSIALSEEGG